MNWKTWVPLVLAIVLGVVAAKVARDAILKNRGNAANDGKFTRIVVAKGDLEPGKELAEGDLTLTQVQADMAPANAFTDVKMVVGRVTEAGMVKGQSIVEPLLAPQGAGSGLQALVKSGMRAITLEVNEFSGVAGLLTPGCHVDVLATINEGNSNGGQIAKTIVQNVKVMAVGQKTNAAGNEPPMPNEMFKSVTVLASLADAEAIELACSTGRPRLVLRGGRDQEIASTTGITLGELRGSGSRNGDPFVTEPVAVNPTPTTLPTEAAPTTRPIEADAVARRDSHRRVVKMIKAGVESSVTLRVDGIPETAVGTTDATDPFGGQ